MPASDTIDAARLEAAQMEWERHERERRVLVGRVNLAYQEFVATIGLLDGMRGALAGMREHLEAGDWITSPKAMAAKRAKSCQEGTGAETVHDGAARCATVRASESPLPPGA